MKVYTPPADDTHGRILDLDLNVDHVGWLVEKLQDLSDSVDGLRRAANDEGIAPRDSNRGPAQRWQTKHIR